MKFLLILASAVALAAPHNVPTFFLPNSGQAPPGVHFMAKGSGLTAYFASRDVIFHVGGKLVHVEFEGASPREVDGTDRLSGQANFLIGPEPDWRLGTPIFGAVRYRELYPGIDMIYGASGRDLKSEFVVAPGVDPARIRMRYVGDGEPWIDRDGSLSLSVSGDVLREQAPCAFQEIDGRRVYRVARFALRHDGTVGFVLGDYDPAQPLVIDPVLSYSTLLGGSYSDAAMGVAVDSTGAAYLAGFTSSYDFPTASPKQNFNAGSNDVFIAKLNPSGNGLVYATYIGGSGDDRANAIAVDSSGAAYVTGSTMSANFPLLNPLQPRYGGNRDAFVLKLSPAGNALVYSTYLGAAGADAGNGIAVDASGSAYVVGDTNSVTLPATGYQRANRGGQDVFIARLKPDGSGFIYSTYFGGSNDDHGAAIAVDANGAAWITGSTWSTDFPITSAFQSALAGGQDAFVARLSADGTTPLFSTYLGGSGGSLSYPESGLGIAVDQQGSAYISGVTSSQNFPVLGPAQSALRGWTDAFVTKISQAGKLVYSTYLGGTGIEYGNAIAVDPAGAAYVTGYTYSSDLPVVNAIQTVSGGQYDAFLAKLNPAGSAFSYLSYLGGNGSDTGTSLALDPAGSVYIAGWTLSTNFPLLNPFQSINGGNYSAFVTKVLFNQPPVNSGVSPNSGTGTSQPFAFQFSDPNGAADLTSVSVLFNTAPNLPNSCSVIYYPGQNALALLTDAGGVPTSTITPGSGTQQNSQCLLNGGSSSVTISGNLLTLNLALTFQPGFTGPKNIYMQAVSPFGTTPWQQTGTWTVGSTGPPMPVSVSPNSGTGQSQTFSFVYSDGNGYGSIAYASIIVNGTLTTVNGCYVLYIQSSNTLYLTNDAATAWNGPVTPGQSGTLQNSQCILNAASSSVAHSGSNLTLNVALTFQPAFKGARYIYLDANDGQQTSGWVQRGTWTVPAGSAGPPSVVSVTPGSGGGSVQTFSFLYSDTNGYSAIAYASVVVNSRLTTINGCYLWYIQASNALYLTNDAATAWNGPVTPGQSGFLHNSQCAVNAATSSVTRSGTNLTLNLTLSFTTAFDGAKYVYMDANDGQQDSTWQQRGTWTVTGGNAGPPEPVSVTPSSGTGTSQTFAFVSTDPNGYAVLSSVSFVIGSRLTTAGVCYLMYLRASNTVYLANDAGTAWLGPVTLGQSGTAQNSQCTVTGAGSSASGAGANLTVNLALSFQVKGALGVYMEAYDGVQDSGWKQEGTWTSQ